jgi:hypothetical protein
MVMPVMQPKTMPLSYKPDFEDAAKRWEAYYAGEIIDRPIVCVTAPCDGTLPAPSINYRDRAYGDMDEVIDRALLGAERTYYAGESIPSFMLSFGPDEIAVFCGAQLEWSSDSGDTNWSKPCIEKWDDAFPIVLQQDHPLWQRMLAFYKRASERMAGKMLITPPDLHTNMDLLSAMRGPQRLCIDLLERPETIDRAMIDARAVFPVLWEGISKEGRMNERGYVNTIYSMEGTAFLQCDFAALIGPSMFKRWVLPALEEEADIVKHVVYHWDGPSALVHTDLLIQCKGLHTLSFVPGDGNGTHINFLHVLKRVQAGGKAVQVWGTPEEMKALHRELRPEKTMYCTTTATQAEADELLKWFVKNT